MKILKQKSESAIILSTESFIFALANQDDGKKVFNVRNLPANGRAQRVNKLFSMQYSVKINIDAKPAIIWTLLTDATAIPTWNSTIDKIEGRIADGERIKLFAKISPNRAFSLNVAFVEAERIMAWKSGVPGIFRGIRFYLLEPKDNGTTDFTMSETFSGVMLPMAKGALPDFTEAFEQFAADLKKAAEAKA